MIDLDELAAEYVATPVVPPTPVSVIVARGRRLRARRFRLLLVVGTIGVAVSVATVATFATIGARHEPDVRVITPEVKPTSPPATTSLTPATSAPVTIPNPFKQTGPADPRLITALAAELPSGYRLQSSDAGTTDSGTHHFEEAIFQDDLGNVARASVFDVSPGESIGQEMSTLGGTPSGTPGIYLGKNADARTNGHSVFARLKGNRLMILTSLAPLFHPKAHPFSDAFLIHAAVDLAAKL